MNIVQCLENLNLVGNGEAAAGRLETTSEILETPEAAFSALRSFGGEGWLCSTHSRIILRLHSATSLDTLPDTAWPIAAELANGEASLHLTRTDTGWVAATHTRKHADPDQAVLLAVRLMARDGKPDLLYEVSWETGVLEGLEELRPRAYRFTGFAKDTLSTGEKTP